MRKTAAALLGALLTGSLAPPTAAIDLADGDLLVANSDGWGILVRLRPAFGFGLQTRTTTSVAGFDPNGIAFDPLRYAVYKGDQASPSLYQEDMESGVQSLLSEGGGSPPPLGSGPSLDEISDLLIEAGGTIAVLVDSFPNGNDGILAVDPSSGQRSIISSSSVGTGLSFNRPARITRESDGDFLVLDFESASGSRILLRVDRATGNRTVVSSSLVGSGPPIPYSRGLAVDAGGTIYTAAAFETRILAIDPTTGNRTLLSSDAVGTGPLLDNVMDAAVDGSGNLLVLNDSGPDSALLSVDPVSGNRSVVASGSVGTGPSLVGAGSVAVEASGDLLVRVPSGLLRIDPVSGDRSVLSSPRLGAGFDILGVSSGTGAAHPQGGGLALEPGGARAVVGRIELVGRVDLGSGDRTVLSASGPGSIGVGLGPDFISPEYVLFEAAGTVLVSDDGGGYGSRILRVFPDSGDRELLSSSIVGAGPALFAATDLAKTPDGRIFVADLLLDAIVEVDPSSGDRSLVSGPGLGSGIDLDQPTGMAPLSNDFLVVMDKGLQSLIRVDLGTGNRSVLSGGGVGSGPSFVVATDVAVDREGSIFVTDFGAQPSVVAKVDPVTGDRSIFTSGGILDVVRGIAVVDLPPPMIPGLSTPGAVLLLFALAAGGGFAAYWGSLRSRRPTNLRPQP